MCVEMKLRVSLLRKKDMYVGGGAVPKSRSADPASLLLRRQAALHSKPQMLCIRDTKAALQKHVTETRQRRKQLRLCTMLLGHGVNRIPVRQLSGDNFLEADCYF